MQYVYTINDKDVITSVSDSWDKFAEANNTKLTRSRVLFASIWNHISNSEVKHIYGLLYKRIRQMKRNIDFDFRCDSPTLRRYMHMSMSCQKHGDIQMISTIVRIENRESVALLDYHQPHRNEVVVMCSWCKKVKTDETVWLEVEDAINKMHLFAEQMPPKISHGICPHCKNELISKI